MNNGYIVAHYSVYISYCHSESVLFCCQKMNVSPARTTEMHVEYYNNYLRVAISHLNMCCTSIEPICDDDEMGERWKGRRNDGDVGCIFDHYIEL